MTYKQAEAKSFKVKWRLKRCPEKKCWCSGIDLVTPIPYINSSKGEKDRITNVIGFGMVEKRMARHIVKVHNASI